MPYFKNKDVNILFIHIPKTGGTSIEHYFIKKYGILLSPQTLFCFADKQRVNGISLQHQTYISLKNHPKRFEMIKWNEPNFKILTIVRNPYTRLLSALFFHKLIDQNTESDKITDIVNNFIISKYDNHNLPQYKFITNNDGKLIDNIVIFKTETLNQQMQEYGYKDFDIHKDHDSKIPKIMRNKYLHFFNNKTISIINEIYEKDFELFGYEKHLVK